MADTMNESSFRGPREVPVFRTDAAEGDTVYRWNLNESKFRADNRQFNFRSESPRLDSPVLGPGPTRDRQDLEMSMGPGMYRIPDPEAVGHAPTPTLARADRFSRPKRDIFDASDNFSSKKEALQWLRSSRTISPIARDTPPLGQAPSAQAVGTTYDIQKDDIGSGMENRSNAAVIMRSTAPGHVSLAEAQLGPGNTPGPGEYDPKPQGVASPVATRDLHLANYYFRKKTAQRRVPPGTAPECGMPGAVRVGTGTVPPSIKPVPGPGHYDLVSKPARFDSANMSAAFQNVERTRARSRTTVQRGSAAKAGGTAEIDSNWCMATDAKAWGAGKASPPYRPPRNKYCGSPRFEGTSNRGQHANRSPFISRQLIREVKRESEAKAMLRRSARRRRSSSNGGGGGRSNGADSSSGRMSQTGPLLRAAGGQSMSPVSGVSDFSRSPSPAPPRAPK